MAYSEKSAYQALLDGFGADMAQTLHERLYSDVQSALSGLKAGLIEQSNDLIDRHSHVLIALTGVVGNIELSQMARSLNDDVRGKPDCFPNDKLQKIILDTDSWCESLRKQAP